MCKLAFAELIACPATQGPVGHYIGENALSILEQACVPDRGPQIITICGDAGMGKSSLAATFPKPIFIRAEDGVSRIPAAFRPHALPLVRIEDGEGGHKVTIWDQLKALIHDDHDYKTCVVDTVSALDRIFVDDVLKQDGRAKTLQTAFGGWGAGYNALATRHQSIRKAAEMLRARKGMNVVFLAHADVVKSRLPDVDDFDRYTLRMTHKDSLPPYIDDVDAVGFLRQRMVVKGDEGERKKAIGSGERELVMHLTPANVSKNAYGITDVLPVKLGENPLAEFITGEK